MANMPNWFAKTPEMVASDVYFSLADAGSEAALVDRYHQTLARLQDPGYFDQSSALSSTTTTKWKPSQTATTLHGHFRGHWIHTLYGSDPKHDAIGGRYWPQVPSALIVERVRIGTAIAIHKALGESELRNLGMSASDIAELFEADKENGVELDGLRPIAMSWNCVAPTGENFFEVDALRGPSAVEFAIATPRPYGHASVMGMLEQYELGLRSLGGGEPTS